MKRKLVATTAVLLLILPALTCSLSRSAPAAKWHLTIARVPPIVNGRDLRSAQAVPSYENVYNVSFTLKAPAAAKFGIWTAANINQYLGVVHNGRVHSIAFIKSQIFDSGEIEGGFTKQSAEDLAKMLQSGPLPAPVKIVEEGAN